MADIRIKDLPTTATQTASDDFIALDGTVNGTRKIDASAPSFKTSVTSPSVVAPAATNLTLTGGSTGASLVLGQGGTGGINLQPKGGGNVAVSDGGGGNWAVISTVSSSSAGSSVYSASPSGTITASNPNWYVGHRFGAQGPLSIWTYNGGAHVANYLTIAPTTGNVLIGGTTDITGSGGLKVFGTTAASTSQSGAFQVGGSTAALSVGIGGGNVNAGGGLTLGSNIEMSAATNIRFNGGTGLIYTGGYSYALSLQSSQLNLNTLSNSPITTGTGLATFGGAATFANSTASTGAGTGALQVAGGIYAGAASVFGGKFTSAVSTATGYNQLYDVTGLTTGRGAFAISSTGAALSFGVEASVGGTSLTGSAAYSSYFGTSNATPVYLITNGVIRQTIDSTGAATFAGAVTVSSTTAGSAGAGALVVSGGLATGAASYFGGDLTIPSSIVYTNRVYNYTGGATPLILGWTGSAAVLSLFSSGAATFSGAVAIGNTVNTVSPTSPNRTVTMVIGGVTYYLAAKTTND